MITYPQENLDDAIDRRVTFSQTAISGSSGVNLGVIGAGNFAASVLLPTIKKVEGINLIGIASARGSSAQNAARQFGFDYAASESEQIIQDPSINTIAVLTRHDLHAGLVVAALNSNKHVFCEKPLALNCVELEQVEKALHHQQGTGSPRLLMVGFNRRFAPMAKKLRSFYADRREPMLIHYRVNAGYLPPTHWLHDAEAGGGRIIAEGCHFIDFITFLAGVKPVQVSAQGIPDSGIYREDNVVLTVTFEDGTLGMVTYLANGDKSFPKERVEVFCAGRVAVLDDFRSLELVKNGRREVLRSRLRQDKGHKGEWDEFSRAIREGGEPPIAYGQLSAVARATFAAVEALRTGERVMVRQS